MTLVITEADRRAMIDCPAPTLRKSFLDDVRLPEEARIEGYLLAQVVRAIHGPAVFSVIELPHFSEIAEGYSKAARFLPPAQAVVLVSQRREGTLVDSEVSSLDLKAIGASGGVAMLERLETKDLCEEDIVEIVVRLINAAARNAAFEGYDKAAGFLIGASMMSLETSSHLAQNAA